jgi:hypothetical protein
LTVFLLIYVPCKCCHNISKSLRVPPQPLKLVSAQSCLTQKFVEESDWDVSAMLMAEHNGSLPAVRLFPLPNFVFTGAFQCKAHFSQHFPKLPICDHASQPQKFPQRFFAV